MLLENDIIKLRALEPEDLDILYKWENDTRLWIHGNTLAPYSRLALRHYIAESQQQDIYQAKQIRFMIDLKLSANTIGTIDLYDFDFHSKKSGIGILIDESYRGKDYAVHGLELIKEYAFSFLQIEQLYAYIAVDNVYSIRLFEKNGYMKSGELINWICCNSVYKNVFVYQLIKESRSQR